MKLLDNFYQIYSNMISMGLRMRRDKEVRLKCGMSLMLPEVPGLFMV